MTIRHGTASGGSWISTEPTLAAMAVGVITRAAVHPGEPRGAPVVTGANPLQQPEPPCALDRPAAGLDVELAVDAARVGLDRVEGDVQRAADLALRERAGHHAQDAQLRLGELAADHRPVRRMDPRRALQPAFGPPEHLGQDPRAGATVDRAAGEPEGVGRAVAIAVQLARLGLREPGVGDL